MCDVPAPYGCKRHHREPTRALHTRKRRIRCGFAKIKANTKRRALDTMELPSQICNQAVRFTGQSVQGQMPSISATKKLIQRARAQNDAPCQHLQISHLSLYQTSTNFTVLHPTSTNYSYSEIVDKLIPIA